MAKQKIKIIAEAPRARNVVAAGLACAQFQPRSMRASKGKGSYRRTPKHRAAIW